MAKKLRLTHGKGAIPAVEQQPSEPSWVKEMHEHFLKTGSFRPEHLERVLGDPRHGVEVRIESAFPPSDSIPK